MTPEELKKFCAAEDDCRYYIQGPFSHGDYTYATDGRIMVRVPRIELEETERSREAAVKLGEKAEKMFSDWSQAAEFLPIPAVELPPMTTCKYCDGTGKVETFASTEVGDARFQNKYLFMIAALPNSKIAPDGDNGAYITFDGGEGLLMPTRK